MPTFDVQVTADAYGEQQFPYVVEVDAPIVGLAEIVWPAGLFSLEPSTSLDFSAGESEQMLGGYRQRIQTAGKYAVLSGRMEWGGAESATMRQWLLAAQYWPWVAHNVPFFGSTVSVHGHWLQQYSVITEPGRVSVDIEALLTWE